MKQFKKERLVSLRNSWYILCVMIVSSAFLFGQNRGYRPIISNDLNTSAYDWNAFSTRWINMRMIAMAAVDDSHFYQNEQSRMHVGEMSHYDRWDVRGLRLGAAGTINFEQPWTYLMSGSVNSLMKDFDSNKDKKFTLLDCVVGIPVWGEYGRLQIGKMKEPISMERTMGMVFEQVMERPMHLDALLTSRNTGVTVSDLIWNKRIRWRIGLFNNWLDENGVSFSDANYQITGRVTSVIYEDAQTKKLLHIGGAYRYEKIKEGSIRYDVGPEFYFSPPWLDTGTFAADASYTFNAEFTYLDGPLWIASEYTQTIVDTPEDRLHFNGYHIALNYFLTGEHRGYNKRRGTVRRITPVLDFDKGGWGAVEVSARYSFMDLSDKEITGGQMEIVSTGIVWHPRRDHQFHLQWSRARLKNRTTIPIERIKAGKSHTDMLQFRWVFVID